ncbi:membrane protein [Thalassotalea insulae]|uniref:Membrane protein n=1 Tax=Thalassotalea insulae TaxID=2056778 RepID=A0ABQ6H063_9GAMM|nr:glycine zipper 2TM domain-containing protein [Thalassotalea insulae]GLX80125.1 membrane protein [Thalassotalea insulae]
MKPIIVIFALMLMLFSLNASEYQRNKAVPVEKVLFGAVTSVRNITEKELIEDQANGWQVFSGAVLGGVIGHQFGSGSGNDVATILGAFIGASIAGSSNKQGTRVKRYQLVELMIKTDNGDEYMVVQEKDSQMLFAIGDNVRMVYLAGGFVRIDKQM